MYIFSYLLEYAQKIFEYASHGWGASKITRALREEKVPTPGWLNYTRYGTFANIYADAPEEKSWAWTISQVKSIVHDEVYIGNSVHGQQTTISYKNKKRIRKPEEFWFRVENTHEALVPKDVFERIQEQIERRRRKMKNATTQIFAGLLKCADCGWSLSYAYHDGGSRPFGFYNCTAYRQFGKKGDLCTSHYIRYDILYEYVLSQIKHWSRLAQTDERGLLEHLLKSGDREKNAALKKRTSELTKTQKRKAEVDKLFARVYEDRVNETISEQNFMMLSQKYQNEQAELTKKIEKLTAEISEVKQTEADAEKWIALLKQFSDPDKLDAPLLNALIEKIEVHEAEKDEIGMRVQDVDIYYRFVGKIA